MKTKITIILFAIFLLLSGCGTKTVNTEDAATLPQEDGAKEITVQVRDVYFPVYEKAGKKFEEQTGVKVNLIKDSELDIDIVKTRITAELMAGKGADVYCSQPVNMTPLGYNGLICDVAGWIEQDPGINKDAYYTGIMSSVMSEGKLYEITLNFMPNCILSTQKIAELEGQKNMTWEQFIDKSKDIKRKGALIAMYDTEIFQARLYDIKTLYTDEKNKTLDIPAMIALLKQCKEWGEQGLCFKFNDRNNHSQDSLFFHGGSGSVLPIIGIQENPKYYMYPMPADANTNASGFKISFSNMVSINAASKAKGTAWKFVKFLLSEEIQKMFDMTSVNRNIMEQKIDNQIANIQKKIALDSVQAKQDLIGALNTIDEASEGIFRSSPSYEIIFEEAKRYFSGEISAEEAAENMANKVELYFKEQRYKNG